jgi:phosphoenolpyruvate carboxykinase (GTP)
MAMMEAALPGYTIRTIGDDIAWLNIGPDGRLRAINPEAGFFGVAPGTSAKTNPNMLRTLKNDRFFPTLFTNTALATDANEPWWEGLTDTPPAPLRDWQGNPWTPASGTKASHPNARFTASIYNCPVRSPAYDDPNGVPISAIIVGGRRAHTIPLVVEAFNWQHGVFLAARMGSETTAAATNKVGVVRRDPMAMLPFCGYNMGDYFGHWLAMGRKMAKPPKIFSVNWFRVDENGKYVWPGFGDNIRVLKWILARVNNAGGAHETPIGLVPGKDDIDCSGLALDEKKRELLFAVTMDEWRDELAETKKFLDTFGKRMPRELWEEYEKMARHVPGASSSASAA